MFEVSIIVAIACLIGAKIMRIRISKTKEFVPEQYSVVLFLMVTGLAFTFLAIGAIR